jgi:hypothetical protein
MIPHVQGLYEEFSDKGLVIFAPHVQSADRETLEMFMLKRGMTYPVAVRSNTQDYPGNGIPRAAIIGVNGNIIWEGHPGSSECNDLIESELKKVDLYGERTIIKSDKPIAKNIFKGKLGDALKAAKKKIGEKKEGETASTTALDAVVARLESKAKAIIARAEKMVEAGDYFGGDAKYAQIEKSFKGSEFADTAKEARKTIKAKDDYKDVKKAFAIWSQIKKKASDKKKDAIAMAGMLVNNPKFAGTYYGKQAGKVSRLLGSVK